MKRSSKVAISLPTELLSHIDTVRRRRGETRSTYFRQAAAERLASEVDDRTEQYLRGYREQPETADEVAMALQTAAAVLATEPWD